MITLTDNSAEKVREFLSTQATVADTAGLRVGVRGGGCSGFQYALAFDEQRDGRANCLRMADAGNDARLICLNFHAAAAAKTLLATPQLTIQILDRHRDACW